MFGFWKSFHIKRTTFTIFSYCSPPLGERWLPLVTHVTPARNLTQFNSTHEVESIK